MLRMMSSLDSGIWTWEMTSMGQDGDIIDPIKELEGMEEECIIPLCEMWEWLRQRAPDLFRDPP
jgi:hypothetical protein